MPEGTSTGSLLVSVSVMTSNPVHYTDCPDWCLCRLSQALALLGQGLTTAPTRPQKAQEPT